jgi:dolichyl-phosphate beta-glucosyltransferase
LLLQLSIIIPAHNEEPRLPESLRRIADFLGRQAYQAEVLIVENGSTDRTAAVAEAFIGDHPDFHLLREPGSGKGRAVRRGMLAAGGAYRFVCDADLSMPIEQISRFLPPDQADFDVAIASREMAGAVRYGEPPHRHWIGRAYNLMVRLLLLPGLQDTQCGFKAFSAAATEDLFSAQILDGWGFDVEVLYIAMQRGYRIVEVPIDWYYRPGSRLHLLKDSRDMFLDLLRVRRNWRRGLYAPPD